MNIEVLSCAINELKQVINNIETKATITSEDYIVLEKELNSFLVNLSAYKIRNIKKGNDLLIGFQYAFNLIKHEKKIVTTKKVIKGGFTFPISFPLESPCNEIYWIDVSNIKPKKNFAYQHYVYLETLNNKRIIETIKKLEKVLYNNSARTNVKYNESRINVEK